MKILNAQIRQLSSYWIQEGSDANPILVFIHGFPDDARAWSHQIEYFAKNYQVIAPFLPGVRDNHEIPKERYQLESLCLDVLKIIKIVDKNAGRNILIVGHNLGCAIAYELKNVLGPKLKGLIFISGTGQGQFLSKHKNLKQLLKSYYMYLFQIPVLSQKFLRLRFDSLLEKVHDMAAVDKTDEIRTHTPISVLKILEFYRQLSKKPWSNPSETQRISSIPTLFIWGEHDSFIEIPTMDEIEHFHKNAQLQVLDGHHWIHRSQPQQVNMLIEQFAKEHL